MNDINKRYNIGLSIINNNQGVKAMLNNIIKPSKIIKSYKIFNRLKSIINKVFENVGYFFIGYKVDIEQNQSDILEAKAKIRILRSNQSQNTKTNEINEYGIKALRDTQSHNIDDIKVIQKKIHLIKVIQKYKIGLHEFEELKKEVEAVKDTLNKLRRDCAKQKKTPTKNKVNELLFTTNNKMLNDCSRELINFVLDANEYDDKVDIKDVNNILRKHINLTNERGQDGTK